MKHNQQIGQWGEPLAHLNGKGYKRIGQNGHTPYGAIDRIAEKDGIAIFVEVKTRTNQSFGNPEDAVNPHKKENLLTCAEYYAHEHDIDHWQIDVIASTGKAGGRQELEHFENVPG